MIRRLCLLALSVGILATACTGGGSPTPSASGPLLPATPTSLPPFDPATFQRLLAQLKGTPVVVNVWASWCGPCIKEAPALASVSTTYQGRVQFLGVDIQDQTGPATQFIDQYGWTYPSVFDRTGAIRDSMGLIGQPQTVFFDAQGKRVCVRSGPTDQQFLTETLDTILSGGGVAEACPAS